MAQMNSKSHKHTRKSLEWGEDYSYYERNVQLKKAHDLMEGHHAQMGRGRRKCLISM